MCKTTVIMQLLSTPWQIVHAHARTVALRIGFGLHFGILFLRGLIEDQIVKLWMKNDPTLLQTEIEEEPAWHQFSLSITFSQTFFYRLQRIPTALLLYPQMEDQDHSNALTPSRWDLRSAKKKSDLWSISQLSSIDKPVIHLQSNYFKKKFNDDRID